MNRPEKFTEKDWESFDEARRFGEWLQDMFAGPGEYITHDGPIRGVSGICGRPETWNSI